MHIVHVDPTTGQLAVIGVLFSAASDTSNPFIDTLNLEGLGTGRSINVPMRALLRQLGDSFFTYSGSLTTPPCTEGVTWIVMKDV